MYHAARYASPTFRRRGGFASFALLIFFYSAFVFSELVLRAATVPGFFGIGLLYLFLFSMPPALFCFGLCKIFSEKVSRILSVIFTVLILVGYDSQLIYYGAFKTYYSAYSFTRAGQATDFVFETLLVIKNMIFPFLLLFVPLVVVIILLKKAKGIFEHHTKAPIVAAIAMVITHCLAVLCTFVTGRGIFSPYDLYFQTSSLNQSVEQLGMFTSFRINIQRLIFGEPDIHLPDDTDSSVPKDSSSEPEIPVDNPTVYKPNTMDIDFDTLIADCTDDTILKMHKYFKNAEITMTNDKTGIFEGCNLIYITAESFSPYAIDKDRTPTLYKMMTEGYQFTNFYTPGWGVSTLDGEYVNCLGLIPKSGVWSLNRSSKNLLPFALGNQYRKLGFQTFAYHNHTFDFYGRDESHPNLGYTYKAKGNGLDVKGTWPESDLEMIDKTTPEYLNGNPFHIYYLTVSGHMNYTFIGNSMASKNRDLVRDLPLSEECQAYLACNIELDRAMELLLARLEEAGQAENTVIVIQPDHYPYGLSKESIDTFAGHEVEENFELYKSVLIMYKKGMTPQVIDRPCANMDVLPTVSNLMGLKYDSRLLMGKDIFSDSDPLVIFANRSWITDKAMYNQETKEVTSLTGEEISEEYIKSINSIVQAKFLYSAKILENDYYRILFGDSD